MSSVLPTLTLEERLPKERDDSPSFTLTLALVASDLHAPSWSLHLQALDAVHIGRGGQTSIDPVHQGRRVSLQVQLGDPWVSGRHVRLTRERGAWFVEDLGSKNGTRYNGALLERAPLADGALLEIGRHFLVVRQVPAQLGRRDGFVTEAGLVPPAPWLRTFHLPLERQFAALATIARRDIPVLIVGASGTGKEVVAQAVHQLSGREPLVAVRLTGGAEPVVAAGGTLFLDEVGELSAQQQATLLRLVQKLPPGVRLVATTSRELERADLLARLRGFELRLPTLGERREDLGLLLRPVLPPGRLELTAPAARVLLGHDWPLNVHELQRVVTTAAALAEHGVIELGHLPAWLQSVRLADGSRSEAPRVTGEDRAAVEALLLAHAGNIAAAARAVGKKPMQIYRWIDRHGIDVDELRKRAAGDV